jgi:hypothetical protein
MVFRELRLPSGNCAAMQPVALWVSRQSSDFPQHREAVGATRPMAPNRVRPCTPHNGAENRAHEDDIVRVADHWYEIGDHVHREGEICKQERKPGSWYSRQRAIPREPPKKAQRVRQDAEGLREAPALGASSDKEPHKSDPGNQKGNRRADQDAAGGSCDGTLLPRFVLSGSAWLVSLPIATGFARKAKRAGSMQAARSSRNRARQITRSRECTSLTWTVRYVPPMLRRLVARLARALDLAHYSICHGGTLIG